MIYARCIDCDEWVETDEDGRHNMVACPGGTRCKGDDYTADHRADDPRHGQAEGINRRNER